MFHNSLIQLALAVADGTGAAAAAGGAEEGGGIWGAMIPLVLMFGIFYFLLIRPQQKKQKAHQEMLGKLKRGEDIVLASGILGRIVALSDAMALIEIAPRVRVRVHRSQIAGSQSEQDKETSRMVLAAGSGETRGSKGKKKKAKKPARSAPPALDEAEDLHDATDDDDDLADDFTDDSDDQDEDEDVAREAG